MIMSSLDLDCVYESLCCTRLVHCRVMHVSSVSVSTCSIALKHYSCSVSYIYEQCMITGCNCPIKRYFSLDLGSF